MWVTEGALAAEKDAEENTKTPDLGVRSSVLLSMKDLCTSKGHGAEEAVEVRGGLTRVTDDSRAKVDEFDVPVGVDDTVLVLDVTVADAQLVQEVDCLYDLCKDPRSSVLGEAAVLFDALEKIA